MASDQGVRVLSVDEALALATGGSDIALGALDEADAVVIGRPADVTTPDVRTADPTVIVAVLARRFPEVRWFVTASFERDFPYNLARRIGSLSALTGARIGVALVPSPTVLPTERAASPQEILLDGAAAIRGLWESWPLDSVVADRRTRLFVDSERIRLVDHDDVFRVRGPLQVPVDAASLPPIAVWGEEALPGVDLVFGESPDPASADADAVRVAAGGARTGPVLVDPAPAFTEQVVLH